MGDSGGFSIALHVYLQSFSQAKAIWGDHQSMVIWDNAAARVTMGGAGNVHDLDDISRLMGEFIEKRKTVTTGRDRRSIATQPTPRRVLSPEEIRTLEFGRAVVVSRAARPVEVQLTPWWKRKDAKQIAEGKAKTEQLILQYTQQEARRRAGHRDPAGSWQRHHPTGDEKA